MSPMAATPRAVTSFRQVAMVDQSGRLVREVDPPSCAGAPFEWASITKTLTAAVAHELHADRRLDLDEPIAATGGLYAAAPAWITPRSLIDHRSGLPRLPDGMDDRSDPYRGMTRERFRGILPTLWGGVMDPSGRPPSYSNLGYALLTDLLEQCTGRTWQHLAVTHLAALGVTGGVSTRMPDGGLVRKTLFGRTREPWSIGDGPFIGAGGLWGTLDALLVYAQATRERSGTLSSCPPGWASSGGYRWHTGASRDCSAFVGFSDDVVLAAGTIGFGPFEAEKVARKALGR